MKPQLGCDCCGDKSGVLIQYNADRICPVCLKKRIVFDGAVEHLRALLTDLLTDFKAAYADILPLRKLYDIPEMLMAEVVESLREPEQEGVQPAELVENAAD